MSDIEDCWEDITPESAPPPNHWELLSTFLGNDGRVRISAFRYADGQMFYQVAIMSRLTDNVVLGIGIAPSLGTAILRAMEPPVGLLNEACGGPTNEIEEWLVGGDFRILSIGYIGGYPALLDVEFSEDGVAADEQYHISLKGADLWTTIQECHTKVARRGEELVAPFLREPLRGFTRLMAMVDDASFSVDQMTVSEPDQEPL